MIQLAKIFQDNMILQRQKPIRIWGVSDRKREIKVYINDSLAFEGSINAGDFSIYLSKQDVTKDAVLKFTEQNNVLFQLNGVDIGEIWIAGGQSNMEFYLEYDIEAETVLPNASHDHIRLYDVGKYTFEGEAETGLWDNKNWDEWNKLNPDIAKRFPAVAYYFTQKLKEYVDIPIGIVGCNLGSTSAFAWQDKECIRKRPELADYLTFYENKLKDIDMKKYHEIQMTAKKAWQRPRVQRKVAKLMKGTLNPIIKVLYTGLFSSIKSFIPETLGPYDPNRPGGLYEMMVTEIKGFSCKGVLWYQGEQDDHNGYSNVYSTLFTSMIECWRNDWSEELPFLFVQLAPFKKWVTVKAENFVQIREQQEKVYKTVPNTWMISIMDSGKKKDIHPQNKRPVGERLALMALGKVYNNDIECEPPEATSVQRTDDLIYINFVNTADGLYLKNDKISALKLFINGRRFRNVNVTIEPDGIVLKSKKFIDAKKVEINFAKDNYCKVNLYNSKNLPAKPFSMSV